MFELFFMYFESSEYEKIEEIKIYLIVFESHISFPQLDHSLTDQDPFKGDTPNKIFSIFKNGTRNL